MKTRILHITRLGLIEMTRKRTSQSLFRQLQVACPCCDGTGRILSVETMASQIYEELRAAKPRNQGEALVIWADPAVVMALIGPHGEYIDDLEEAARTNLYIRTTDNIHPERYEIVPGSDPKFRKQYLPYTQGQVITIQPDEVLALPAMGMVAAIKGYVIEVPEASSKSNQPMKVRFTKVGRSYGRCSPAK